MMDLRTGKPCSARSPWARNVCDVVPILNLIDFVMMCIDVRGQKLMDKRLQVQLVDTGSGGSRS